MLIACSTCHRQYDAGTLGPGARVRCFCGELCIVPEPRSYQAKMLHCSNCGGRLGAEAARCGYCDAEPSPEEHALGDPCPECFGRMGKGARFCCSCGTRIRPEAIVKAISSLACPRCEATMSLCETPRGSLVECTSCGGIWLDEELFERFCDEREQSTVAHVLPSTAANRAAGEQGEAPSTGEQVRYLRCPVCTELMNRKNFASCSGIVIDWCRTHGFWFDARELERILSFIDEGGMDRARENRIRNQELRRKSAARRVPAPADWGRMKDFDGKRSDALGFLGELLVGFVWSFFDP